MSQPASAPFEITTEGGITHLKLNRPEVSNAMNLAFWREFRPAVDALERDGRTRVLIISGAGRNFCAGMDISVFSDGSILSTDRPETREVFLHVVRDLQETVSALDMARFPVIAAIQGACIGGGLELAAACDLRFAAADAYFRIEEINIGMMADLGALQRLPKLMPEPVVKEMALLGATLDAERARSVGFVASVAADATAALDAAMAAAERIVGRAPLAVTASKAAIRYARDHSVADGLDWAGMMQASIWSPPDIMRAIDARAKKQPADFQPLPPVRFVGE